MLGLLGLRGFRLRSCTGSVVARGATGWVHGYTLTRNSGKSRCAQLIVFAQRNIGHGQPGLGCAQPCWLRVQNCVGSTVLHTVIDAIINHYACKYKVQHNTSLQLFASPWAAKLCVFIVKNLNIYFAKLTKWQNLLDENWIRPWKLPKTKATQSCINLS